MITRFSRLIAVLLVIPSAVFSQVLFTPAGYQSLMINNPGATGSAGDGYLRLSYLNHYPGNSFNLHTALVSYDAYFPSLHGGAGFFISDSYLGGIINDIRGGLSYSYFLQAGKDLFFSGGLSASFYDRGYNYTGALLPDQIDPLMGAIYPSAEAIIPSGRTIFDIGTGFMVISGHIFGGFAINHLARPDIYRSESGDVSLQRSYLVHVAGDVGINRGKNILLRPVGKLEIQKGWLSAGAGAVFESSHFSINSMLFLDKPGNIDIQSGFAVNFTVLILNYNYHFNVISKGDLLPLSVMHEAGIAVGLNNVDKRKIIKTINFPKL